MLNWPARWWVDGWRWVVVVVVDGVRWEKGKRGYRQPRLPSQREGRGTTTPSRALGRLCTAQRLNPNLPPACTSIPASQHQTRPAKPVATMGAWGPGALGGQAPRISAEGWNGTCKVARRAPVHRRATPPPSIPGLPGTHRLPGTVPWPRLAHAGADAVAAGMDDGMVIV